MHNIIAEDIVAEIEWLLQTNLPGSALLVELERLLLSALREFEPAELDEAVRHLARAEAISLAWSVAVGAVQVGPRFRAYVHGRLQRLLANARSCTSAHSVVRFSELEHALIDAVHGLDEYLHRHRLLGPPPQQKEQKKRGLTRKMREREEKIKKIPVFRSGCLSQLQNTHKQGCLFVLPEKKRKRKFPFSQNQNYFTQGVAA